MSRARFGILLGLAAAAVAAAAFLLALQALDDGRPDRPPSGTPTTADGGAGGDDDSAATTAPVTGADDPLPSPSWILVVSSEGDEARAREVADAVAAAGHAAGVLRSDDHPSLNPGFWVAFAGPFPDVDAARAAQPEVRDDGFPAAYLRCAGTVADCGGDQTLEDPEDGEEG